MEPLHNIQMKPLTAANQTVAKNDTVSEATGQFSSYLSHALSEVNRQQIESSYITEQFARGQITDVHQVMITAQKASIALELTVQVRNKAVEAYQEMMRMQI